MTDTDTTMAFEPGSCVNLERRYFSPCMLGIKYYICSLLFKHDSAPLPVTAPRKLVVIE